MTCAESRLLPLFLCLTLAACAGPGTKRTTSNKARPAAVAKPAPAAARATNPVSPLPKRAQTIAPAAAPKPAAAPVIAKSAPAPVKVASAKERFAAAVKLIETNQFKEAEPLLEGLVKENPGYSGPLTNLGIVYYKTGRRDLALAAFSRAAVANSRNAIAYNWLGIIYRETGDYARAEQAYLRALQGDSDFADAHLNLGILYDQHLKRPAQALEHYKRYRRLAPGGVQVEAWIAALEPKK